MRIYRCSGCLIGFAIHWPGQRPRSKKALTLTCPLCQKAEGVEEVDAVKEAGGHLAKKALEWWARLP